MTIFRNKKDKKLYKMYVVSPMHVLGSWLEVEDFFTKVVKKIPWSRQRDYMPVAYV